MDDPRAEQIQARNKPVFALALDNTFFAGFDFHSDYNVTIPVIFQCRLLYHNVDYNITIPGVINDDKNNFFFRFFFIAITDKKNFRFFIAAKYT